MYNYGQNHTSLSWFQVGNIQERIWIHIWKNRFCDEILSTSFGFTPRTPKGFSQNLYPYWGHFDPTLKKLVY